MSSRKYSFREIEDYYKALGENSPIFPECLPVVEEMMKEKGISPTDRVWNWPGDAEKAEDAYDRAMGVI